jgi:hypothetical protein
MKILLLLISSTPVLHVLHAQNFTNVFAPTILTADPGTCTVGQAFFNSTLTLWRQCTAVNTWANMGTTTADGTQVFTNKTFDVEGTGNSLTTVQFLTFQAASCLNGTAGGGFSTGATAPTATCVTGSNSIYGVQQFPDSDGEYAIQSYIQLASDWSGVVDFSFRWRSGATTGSIVGQLQTSCVADAETGDPAWNATQTVIDAAKGTTLQWNDATITPVTVTGCAAGETMLFRFHRQRTHASDDLAGTWDLIWLQFKMRRTQ